MGEVGIAVQKSYTNKGSWDNKVHKATCIIAIIIAQFNY